jgi:hypothetical protein
MSVTQHAQRTANRAAGSKTLEYLTRGGFVGYGVVHLLFAWLALQIAFGNSAGDSDQSGALRQLAAQPLGKTLVILTIIGLVAMAVWQGFEAAIGHRSEQGRSRVAERIASAARLVVYLYLAYTGYKVVKGADSSNADSQQKASQHLMAATGGRWLVALIGLGVAAIGVGLVVYGLLKRFEKHLQVARMSARVRTVSRRLGIAGYAAKGVAYAITGVLLVVAAVTYDPDKARGLDGALRTLAEQSYGTWLLGLVALGIAAFGVFCFIQARYRKV